MHCAQPRGPRAHGVLAAWHAALSALASSGAFAAAVAAQDIGFEGPRFTGAGATPTESKPESKLWFNDGSWWGILWSAAGQSFRIHRLDFVTHAWIDTGVVVESRPDSHSDAKWDGTKLYVASHEFSTSGSSGNPILVFRYGYSPATDTYSLDSGFPVTVGNFSTEALVIDKDSTGTLWVAWTQAQRVRISHSLAADTQWNASVVLPTNTSNLSADDICSLIAYNGNRIGVMWSDQNANAYRFSFHVDGAADTAWSAVENATTGEADDHLNLAADSTGRVFAAGKNAANNLILLVRASGGGWSRSVIQQPSPIHTRPIVLLNEQARTIHVFSTGQDSGEVFEKVSSLDSISFPAGDGTIRMRDASAVFRISNPTSTKQNVDASTGLVVLAHHDSTQFYWHHEQAPVAPASYTVFGAGCPGALGVPGNVATALPRVGRTMSVSLTHLPQSAVFFHIGWSNTNSALGPLPLDLGVFGAPGCFGRVSPEVAFLILGAGGTAVYDLAIPNESRHLGVQFYTQGLSLDPGANALGLTATDAAVARVGS